MDQVQVQILESQVGEGLFDGGEYHAFAVVSVPELEKEEKGRV